MSSAESKPRMSEGAGYSVHPDVVHAAKDVLSSIVGSAMCVYSGQPCDTLKVQTHGRHRHTAFVWPNGLVG